MEQPSIYISTPCHSGKVDINYHASMMMTMKFLGENRIQHMMNYAVSTGIDAARSRHATEFLNTPCTHIMFIDDDMAWAPDLILRMAQFDVDIIGVPYRKKTVTPIKFTVTHKEKPDSLLLVPSVIEVDGIATGMMLIKREIFEKLLPLVPAIQYVKDGPIINMFFHHEFVEEPITGIKTYMSEDFNFCRMARENGFKVWAYTDEEVVHMGNVAYRGDYATWMENNGKKVGRYDIPKMSLRLLGDVADELLDLPLECEIDGVKQMIQAQGYKMPNGLLIPYSTIPDRESPYFTAYVKVAKSLYEVEESDKGVLVKGRKVA